MIYVVRHYWLLHVTGVEVPKTHKTFATIPEVSVPHVRHTKWRKNV